MSKDEGEMVTIELPADIAERYRDAWLGKGLNEALAEACHKALEARKSKYERWREMIDNAYNRPPISNAPKLVADYYRGSHPGKLLMAAPQLLDALIEARRVYKREAGWGDSSHDNAIRAALPEDVADEVLND